MDENYIFVNLRFVINETIDANVYRILLYLIEWPMVVGEKPEVYENDFFRNDDWADFFARNGTVNLGNFVAYEEMGIQKVFEIRSYVPLNRKNTVFYFIQWLTGFLESNHHELVYGYIDNGDSTCELITNKRAQPIDFNAVENQ
jgi:hypothetical protein